MFSRSPKVPRKGLQQLKQDGCDDEDRVIAGVEFVVLYVGSTEVSEYCGTGSGKTEVPVARVFAENKSKPNKKSKRMLMSVCYKTLTVKEEQAGRLVASFPISKVTFCNVDAKYEKAFVFIARDRPDNPFKAYVFLCDSKSKAAELFKVLSLAFTLNYESYQASLVRQANLRADARSSPTKSDNHEAKLALDGENQMRFRNGTSDETGSPHIIFDQSAFKEGNESPEIPTISQPRTPSPRNGLVDDKRYRYLAMESATRNRSHTGPPGLIRIPQPPTSASITSPSQAPTNHMANNNNATTTTTTTNMDDDFEAEFTQLAKSRSNTGSSTDLPFHSGTAQRWDSDPGFVRLQIH